MKKSSSSKSLKRPGSPNLSDASGTDASLARKKKKKSRHLSSTQPTPYPSRPISPANVPPSSSAPTSGIRRDSNGSQLDPTKPTKKRKSLAPGARSDNDTAAFSDGGAMSENSRKQKRLKLNVNAKDGTGSPNVQTPQGGSRATSPRPTPAPAQPPAPEPEPSTYPTAEEVYAAIPASGITTGDLSNKFRSRYRKQDRQAEMSVRIREVAKFDKPTRLLFPSETFKAM
jgi:transcription initiation factor TFIIF subunit alpha